MKKHHAVAGTTKVLEEVLEIYSRQQVASFLGIKDNTISTWFNKGTVPLGDNNHLKLILKSREDAATIRELRKERDELQKLRVALEQQLERAEVTSLVQEWDEQEQQAKQQGDLFDQQPDPQTPSTGGTFIVDVIDTQALSDSDIPALMTTLERYGVKVSRLRGRLE